MKIQLKNDSELLELFITWRYETIQRKKQLPKQETTCLIWRNNIDSISIVAEETVTKYALVQGSKIEARMYSLKKALGRLNLTKEERKEIWATYHARQNKKVYKMTRTTRKK